MPGAPDATMTIDAFIAAGGDRAIPVAIFGVKPEYLNVIGRNKVLAMLFGTPPASVPVDPN